MVNQKRVTFDFGYPICIVRIFLF
ncbi:uncharacterized protein METZ01_LOCUS155955 [marine metagenome]|uniref:Uncharacterized protein n=1 Tax=marine metagenome TaxID=408172 RepID=A0A382AP79_9ZZZZ